MGSEMCIRDSFYPEPDRLKGKKVGQLSRPDLALLIQAITGQNNLNYLNNLITTKISPLCRFCEEEDETFEHLLLECVVFNQARRDIFKMQSILDKWTPKAMLKFIHLPDILEAFQTNLTEEYK